MYCDLSLSQEGECRYDLHHKKDETDLFKQDPVDGLTENRQREGFGKYAGEALFSEVRHDRVVGITA